MYLMSNTKRLTCQVSPGLLLKQITDYPSITSLVFKTDFIYVNSQILYT